MNRTNFLKTLLVVSFVWKTALGNPNVFRVVTKRKIFYDEEIVSIASLQEDRVITSNASNMDQLMFEEPNLCYTAVKCKYSDAIVELLRTFFEINEYGLGAPNAVEKSQWLASSIDRFHGVKPAIAKMIDQLFSYAHEFEILKTSDQSLLKSLLSINLFLYYSINDGPFRRRTADESAHNNNIVVDDGDFEEFVKNVRKLNTSIVQMIGLVERFRNKRCVVYNPYKYNHEMNKKLDDTTITDANNMTGLLDPTLKNLHLLVNNESDDYTDFDSDVYDPEYLLFKGVLDDHDSFFRVVQRSVLARGEFDLLSKYENARGTYSIENILEYQYSLVDVLADVFFARVYNIATTSTDRSAITNLDELYTNVEYFVNDVLPITCAAIACNRLLKAYYLFGQAMQISNTTEMFGKLKRGFEPNGNHHVTFYRTVRNEFANDPDLNYFCRSIFVNHRQSFKRVFDLLSYESYTNGDFYIARDIDPVDASTRSDANFVNSLIEFQCALFTFRTVMRVMDDPTDGNLRYPGVDLSDDEISAGLTSAETVAEENDDDRPWPAIQQRAFDKYGRNFANMLRVIVRLHESVVDKPDVRGIVLPLLIRFRHADKRPCQEYQYECQVMSQISFIAITLIENYLIKNNLSASHGLFVYSELMVYDPVGNTNVSAVYRRMRTYLASVVQLGPFTESLIHLNRLYDEPSYVRLFPKNDREMEYFWNGQELIGYEVFMNVQRGIIDFHDVIRFRWFSVKWFIGKILLNLMKTLWLLIGRTKTEVSEEINIITAKLFSVLEFELPAFLYAILADLVRASVRLLSYDSPVFDAETRDEWNDMYEDNLIALGLDLPENPRRHSSLNENITILDADMARLRSILSIPFLGAKNVLTLTKFNLAPTGNAISYSAIRIIFSY